MCIYVCLCTVYIIYIYYINIYICIHICICVCIYYVYVSRLLMIDCMFQVCVVLPAADLHSAVQRLHHTCCSPGKRHSGASERPMLLDV